MADHVQGADCATVIGSDVTVKGEIQVEKGLRIDGRIEGAVRTKGKVLLGKSGHLQAEVHAGTIVIEGKVTGNIAAAERAQIDPSGQVFGDITASKLVVAEGATIVGKINVGAEALKDLPAESPKASLATPASSRLDTVLAGGNGSSKI